MTTATKTTISPTLLTDLVERIRARAARCPDVTYIRLKGSSCSYREGKCTDGSVGCIFGQELFPLLPKSLHFQVSDRSTILSVLHALGFSSRAEEMTSWCNIVQHNQDMGKCWSECVQEANRLYSLPKAPS